MDSLQQITKLKTIIQVPGEKPRDWRKRSWAGGALDLSPGTFGAHQAGRNRFYWLVQHYSESYHLAYIDGFLPTREAALEKAQAVILERFAEGYCFAWRTGLASSYYKKYHAKATQFESHPSGYLWLHEFGNSDYYDRDSWTRLPVMRETERFYYVSGEPITGTEVAVKRNARDAYFRISKAQLKEKGCVYHPDISYWSSVQKDPPPKFYEEYETDGKGYWHRKARECSDVLLRDPSIAASQTADTPESVAKEIKLCRKIAQENHPDKNKGGVLSLYQSAIKRMSALKKLKKSMKRREQH